MNPRSVIRCLVLVLLGLAAAAGLPAQAAAGQDNCTGYIETLPASIGAQGTWCLRGSRFSTQVSGAAVNVLTDNVTIDCNGFRISGLGTGPDAEVIGVRSGPGRQNITVRDCLIEGFRYGVQLVGNGHAVEDNHFFYSSYIGIYTSGDGNEIRNNYVGHTSSSDLDTYGILALSPAAATSRTRVIGNTVSNTSVPGLPGIAATGIAASGLVQDNLVETSSLDFQAIRLGGGVARDNVLLGQWSGGMAAIQGTGESSSLCRDNDVVGYLLFGDDTTDFIFQCQESGTNVNLVPRG